MNTGYLTLQVTTGDGALPVVNARVVVRQTDGTVLYETFTDTSGNTEYFSLFAPDAALTLDPYYMQPAYAVYDVDVGADGFITTHVHDVEIVDTQTAILPVDLKPLSQEPNPVTDIDIDIPPVALLSSEPKRHLAPTEESMAVPVSARNRYAPDAVLPVATAPGPALAVQTNQAAPSPFREVIIPTYITVHLGVPANTAAQNVRVKFVDYIKNVI